MKMSHAFALVPLLMASTAMANPATQEGADHLTQVFQTYLSTTAGVVAVKANGDTYDLTLDATPLFAMAKDKSLTGTITPWQMTLTDNGDGTWGVVQDQAISISVSVPGEFDLKEDVASQKLDGTFDEKLLAFTTMKGSFSGVKVTESVTTPNAPLTTVDLGLDGGTFEGTGAAGAAGGADIAMTLIATGLTETVTPGAAEGQPAMPVSIKAEGLSEEIKGTGIVSDGILKALAWAVAHPTQDAAKADKANLKAILTAGLPFFGNLNASGKVTKLVVGTPMGEVGIDEMGFAVDVNGAVADGKFREAFAVSGLTLPAGLVPAWAAPVLPQKFTVDVQVTDFDAAAGLTAALGALDQPDGMADQSALDKAVQEAFLPKGTVTITLNPGALTGDGYALTYEGSMVAGPSTTVPTGSAKITLAGADKLSAALNAAPDDMKAQGMMGFGMAQGMAKKDDKGNLEWDIELSKTGAVSVNGTPMMGGN